MYGGVLRDVIAKGAHVADDIDVLFTCTVQQLVAACEAKGWKEGTDFKLKTDGPSARELRTLLSTGR